MHGLNTIHTLNDQAVRDEHSRAVQAAKHAGSSYIAFKDELGNVDYTQPIAVFPTVSSLKAHLLATTKAGDTQHLHVEYGFNA
jgi:hypothetical protein